MFTAFPSTVPLAMILAPLGSCHRIWPRRSGCRPLFGCCTTGLGRDLAQRLRSNSSAFAFLPNRGLVFQVPSLHPAYRNHRYTPIGSNGKLVPKAADEIKSRIVLPGELIRGRQPPLRFGGEIPEFFEPVHGAQFRRLASASGYTGDTTGSGRRHRNYPKKAPSCSLSTLVILPLLQHVIAHEVAICFALPRGNARRSCCPIHRSAPCRASN